METESDIDENVDWLEMRILENRLLYYMNKRSYLWGLYWLEKMEIEYAFDPPLGQFSCVYFCFFPRLGGVCKIGHTRNFEGRYSSLRSEYDSWAEPWFVARADCKVEYLERRFHQLFSPWRILVEKRNGGMSYETFDGWAVACVLDRIRDRLARQGVFQRVALPTILTEALRSRTVLVEVGRENG